VVLAASLWIPRAVLPCLGDCLTDVRVGAGVWGELGLADVRLNAWILSWDLRAFSNLNSSLFDATSFHPASASLAGSEHLFGLAAQVFPLSFVTDNATLIYNVSLLSSFVILGFAIYAVLIRLTGQPLAAMAAAVFAVTAPWRLVGLSHLQALSLGWMPVLWWLLLRRCGHGPKGRETLAFMLLTAIQLLSCYYVAYMTTLSFAVFGICGLALVRPAGATRDSWRARFAPARVLRIAAPALPGYALLAAVSLPYLDREVAGGFAREAWPPAFDPALGALAKLWPPQWLPAATTDLLPTAWFPLPLFLLAPLALLWILRPPADRSGRQSGDVDLPLVRAAVPSLLLLAALSVLLAFGPTAGATPSNLHLLADWFGVWVPGYELFRVSERWLSLVSVSLSISAGLGVAWVLSLAEREGLRRQGSIFGGLVVAIAFLYVPTFQVPATPTFSKLGFSAEAYEELASLPQGAVLEVPWDRLPDEAEYQLAAARHWKPLLNGYTGYPPASYRFLRHQAARLPEAETVERLRAMTGLRWILVRKELVDLRPWLRASKRVPFTKVFEDAEVMILEVAAADDAASKNSNLPSNLSAWMLNSEAPATTVDGAKREVLLLRPDQGRVLVEPIAGIQGRSAFAQLPIGVMVENLSGQVWPAADFRREGLLEFVYEYRDATTGAVILKGSAPLLDDLSAGESRRVTFLASPIYLLPRGRAVIRVTLVQRFGEELRPLGLPFGETKLPLFGLAAAAASAS
jgi:hypothetical protein